VFHMYVAKVDRNVSYVAMVVHICCKHLFQMFFKHMLQVCLSGCYICFTHTLQMFYLDIATYFSMAFQMFSGIFVNVSDAYFKCLKCIFKCFICLHTYVSSECFKNRSSTATGVRAGEVGQDTERRSDSTDPTWAHKTECRRASVGLEALSRVRMKTVENGLMI
jgi:hypothetical protein